jgi:amino acid transporter
VTLVVICVYIAVCVGCTVYYWREKRSEWNPWLHGVFPVLGAIAFLAPLYYQFNPLPDYPIRWGTWIAVGWLAAGVVVTAWMYTTRPESLEGLGKVFIEEDAPVGLVGPFEQPPPMAPEPGAAR